MTYGKLINRKTFPTTCKFCGKSVFYHTNDYGSKVYFDELGGIWPIHKCNGYLLAKSRRESNYSSIIGKFHESDIPLNGLDRASKTKAILIKKSFSWEMI